MPVFNFALLAPEIVIEFMLPAFNIRNDTSFSDTGAIW